MLPLLLVGSAVAAITGILNRAGATSKNSRANALIVGAEHRFDNAKDKLERQKDITTTQLNSLAELKLELWCEDIGDFIKAFSRFRRVKLKNNITHDRLSTSINNANLKQLEAASLNAAEILLVGTGALGTGALGTGALTGIATYGGVAMFASASTGTAISTLSGIAAQNATLAWFGGGSLATGGLGMAGGVVALGGIAVGPAMAVAGILMAAKSEQNLAKAKEIYEESKIAVEKMENIGVFLKSVGELVCSYKVLIGEYRNQYKKLLDELEDMTNIVHEQQGVLLLNRIKKFFCLKYKINFKLLNEEQQQLINSSWLATQTFNHVLSSPLLTKDGNIDDNAQVVLTSSKDIFKKIFIGQNCH